jgi:hypothetical protein
MIARPNSSGRGTKGDALWSTLNGLRVHVAEPSQEAGLPSKSAK